MKPLAYIPVHAPLSHQTSFMESKFKEKMVEILDSERGFSE